MPRLWIMSDLHQELARFPWAPPRPAFDVLVVAGDVHEGEPDRAVDWVADLAGGRPAVMVAGNHEFWRGDVAGTLDALRRRCGERGVVLLEGQGWVEVAGVAFAGCTLWTDQALGFPFGRRLYEGEFGEPVLSADRTRRASGAEMLDLHRRDADGLSVLLGADDPPAKPRVVVTHHAPDPASLPAILRRHPQGAFSASDLTHLVACGVADLWVHGHVHRSVDLAMPGGTRLLCNPFGTHGTNEGFVEDLVVEL